MMRDDGAGLHTLEGSDLKAYTAHAFGQPSADFAKRLQDRPDTVGLRHYTRAGTRRCHPWMRRSRSRQL